MNGFSPAVIEAYEAAAELEKLAAVSAMPRTHQDKAEHREYMKDWRSKRKGGVVTAPRPKAVKAPRAVRPRAAAKVRRAKPLRAMSKVKYRKVPKPKMETPQAPFPWQTGGVDFAMKRGGNAVFAHGTGTGKTRSAVMLATRRMAEGARYVVTAPAGVRSGFAESIEKWAPGMKGLVIKSSKDKIPPSDGKTIPVISYELFKRMAPRLRAAGYTDLVFDEAHKAKNPGTGNYKEIMRHRGLFNSALAMTASLTSTEPENLVQLIDIVTNGQHGLGTPGEFRRKYIRTRGDAMGYMSRRRMSRHAKNEGIGYKNEEELGKRLRQYIHHVHESEIDKSVFPKKEVETVEVPMSDDQQKLYLAALKRLPPSVIKRLKSEELSNAEMSSLYNRLIQSRGISGGLHTMAKGIGLEASARLTPKTVMALDDMEKHLAETSDGKIILVSNFIKGGLDVIEAGLKQRGLEYGVFRGKGKGGTSEKVRQAALKRFTKGKLKILLVSPAGFEGLNAPDTTMVQVYDGHFNPEAIRQGEARGIRAGGQSHRAPADRKVKVKRYVSVFPERGGILGAIQKMIGYRSREKHIDQKVWDRAGERHQMNQRLLDLIAGKTRRREHKL
jgi:SNF2 family DNA or RNA helicase